MGTKVMRQTKGGSGSAKRQTKPVDLSLNDMFGNFMSYKRTEGLAGVTIND